MLYAYLSRTQLMKFMPPGACAAEIGVFRGEFSDAILKEARPETLHLIDPWRHMPAPGYQNDGSNVSDDEHESNFGHVCQRFAEPIERRQVVVHRGLSEEAHAGFPDSHFDWIYIDGDHTFEAVLRDLELYAPKVKRDGFILGHDFTNYPAYASRNFGVVPAVAEFRKRHGYALLLLTAESCPSFVLAREPLGEAAALFVEKIIYNVPHVIEIKAFSEETFVYRQITLRNGVERMLPSF